MTSNLQVASEAEQLQQKQRLRTAEWKTYSQFNEDGIVQFLFDRLGSGGKRFVEFGIGNGKECNTANLSIHHGWSGLLMDGNPTDVEKAQRYYTSRPEVAPGQVVVRQAFVTAENINNLLADHAAAGPTDFFSIDIDGNDLWIWKAITAIRPRVVVAEYSATYGPVRSITTPYEPGFERFAAHASGLYQGASLTALTKLAAEKGYILVGCESHGVNAFFVEASAALGAGLVPLSPAVAYYEHAWRLEKIGPTDKQFAVIAHMPFVEI
jgi:hypothetical protein